MVDIDKITYIKLAAIIYGAKGVFPTRTHKIPDLTK